MRYINSTLLKDEQLIYLCRPHWIIFGWAVAMWLLAILVMAYGPQFQAIGLRLFGFKVYHIIALGAALIGVYWFITSYITFKTSEYAITDKRVLIKVGWISRDAFELFLDKVEGLRVGQPILGRLLDYGTLIIIGTGGTQDAFPYVPAPLKFRKILQQRLELYEHPRKD
ncbi:MAG: PH domain-containing protein [Gammaproteobacteria bacterium]|nr:PH domain-containing protein [Gammaproteobacteria bacterium]